MKTLLILRNATELVWWRTIFFLEKKILTMTRSLYIELWQEIDFWSRLFFQSSILNVLINSYRWLTNIIDYSIHQFISLTVLRIFGGRIMAVDIFNDHWKVLIIEVWSHVRRFIAIIIRWSETEGQEYNARIYKLVGWLVFCIGVIKAH